MRVLQHSFVCQGTEPCMLWQAHVVERAILTHYDLAVSRHCRRILRRQAMETVHLKPHNPHIADNYERDGDRRRQNTVYLFTGTLLPVLPTIVAQLGKLCVSSPARGYVVS